MNPLLFRVLLTSAAGFLLLLRGRENPRGLL